ncbi:hypothetical protein F8G81_18840 [Arthrobacter sp. CDRTa11]|uniref:hypothetical protein n=1 Tax=Arthrobacter sp. CDRTa11 TaxID=2651199 RepID=UPI002265F803|nr:hypothetical protein [Arthrobacter sp. CDRTa11]UZX04433.1 hypothetical protein F8G81_18840 [Arthrobacter sp. CDRTa11]
MSTPPVPPPTPNEPESGGQPQAPRYGENAPQFGHPSPQSGDNAPQYGQNAPQYGQNAPQYGQNAPQYGQNSPQSGDNSPQYGQNAPQYGQNPATPQYGQNPSQPPAYGQNPPAPYGQQPYGQSPYGQSPYGQYPSEQPQGSGSSGVPQLVNISFWLLIASGVIYVISMLMGLAMLDDPTMRRQFEDAMASGGAAGEVAFEDIKGVIAGTLVVIAIIGAGLYALVAFFVRKGKNWARILGTVLAAISVAGVFGPPSFGTLGTLAGIVAIVLLYLPAAAPYFRKQQPFANPYGAPGNPYGR